MRQQKKIRQVNRPIDFMPINYQLDMHIRNLIAFYGIQNVKNYIKIITTKRKVKNDEFN